MAEWAGAEQGARLLAGRIREQRERLALLEGAVRDAEADAVHQMRIACRRLRGALRAYGAEFAGVGGELRWLGGVLGEERDCEVQGELLVAAARELPAELGPERVAEWLGQWRAERAGRARTATLLALDSERYAALRHRLAELPGEATPVRTLRALAHRERRRARRLLVAGATDEQLHRARKAAKWARYLGEVGGPEAFTGRMKAWQDQLGRHQDSVVARAALRELAGRPGADPFPLGVLYARQLAVAEETRVSR
ncbi:CHAD domain-containing protein [Kitasatospora sp. NPDC002227]|uniref:CHAD domain-containing protein n=1 Tax=Kitasatospora sp. NPDC002227 TaxID=3154773 RepID=UPI00333135AF